MKKVLSAALVVLAVAPAMAQDRSAGGAFLRSLVLPGWGHAYAHGGPWGASGTVFGLVDAAAWTGLVSGEWHRRDIVDSYRTLAALRAGAVVDGKDRTFFLRMATYRSSDEYLEVSLRNRAWEELNYVQDPAFQWAWDNEEDFLRYRSLREDGETLGRRRSILIATLVANRLIAGLSAARAVRRGAPSDVAFSLEPVRWQTLPAARFAVSF